MRRVITSLATILSLLLVLTSVSASVCDLSCWLHQAHSGCPTVSSGISGKNTAMSMPSDIDMSPDRSSSMTASDASINVMPDHSMSVSPEMEGVTERFDTLTKPEMRTSTVPDHSKGISSCTHEPCSQISISVSPPVGDHRQRSFLHRVVVSISNPMNLLNGFQWIRRCASVMTHLSRRLAWHDQGWDESFGRGQWNVILVRISSTSGVLDLRRQASVLTITGYHAKGRPRLVTREIDVSPLDIGADQFYVEPVTNICSLLPLCQQTFYGRLQDTNKRSVRSHSRNDGIEHLTDSTAHRDGSDSLRHFPFHLSRRIFFQRAVQRNRGEFVI